MSKKIHLEAYGITVETVLRNPSPALLYQEALRSEGGTMLASTGALVAYSGDKTGRSPVDKRIVRHSISSDDIWWGSVNIPLSEPAFLSNRERAIDYLNTCRRLFVIDGFAGWDPKYQLKVRIVCERAYHALFMHNMLIRPTREQLATFGDPDFVVFNSGRFPANRQTDGITSKTSINLSFERMESIILGTEYAGEMKKGVFTLMNYLMPKRGVLSMHCSANEGKKGDVSIFFGLSGTGKTTLSADPDRYLIGDDEHCWSDSGIFNIEGGCYAKVINLSKKYEPEIYDSIRFGSVLENVLFDEQSREVDYEDVSVTTNTRGSYPIEFISNAKVPCVGGHPDNIILLTCDAFGVLPPVARLTPAQAMYHFISGYTAKVAGTEVGVTDPVATFSTCFGAPFLALHPTKYANMLAEKIRKHKAKTWLVNTGWTGGGFGIGNRINLPHTRAIIDAIHSGVLDKAEYHEEPTFKLSIPKTCPGVPRQILQPKKTWNDKSAYDQTARKLIKLFEENFEEYKSASSEETREAAFRLDSK